MIDERKSYFLKCLESLVDNEANVETQSLGIEDEAATQPLPPPSIFAQPIANPHVQARGLMNDDDASEAGKLESLNWKII